MAKNFGIPDDSPILTGQKPDETPVPEPEPTLDIPGPLMLSMAQLQAIVTAAVKAATPAAGGATTVEAIAAGVKAAMEGSAEANAKAMKAALKPENDPAPMVSIFNPEGDRDHPRPKLKCEFSLFDGIPIDGTTDTVDEINLMNQLEAGDYWVSKSDGTMLLFKVREIRNDLGQLRRMDMSFPYRDDADRAGVMPMIVWLRDIVRQIAARAAA